MSGTARTAPALGACCLLLVAFCAIAWFAALDKCATVDEPGHLFGGWTQITFRDFRFNCEQPALFQTITGLGLPRDLFQLDRSSSQWKSLLVGANSAAPMAVQALYHTPGVDADTVLRAERARMLAIAVIIGVVVAWWGWRLAGPVAAIVGLAAFSFDPNFLAHAPLVKNDVISALAFLLFAASVWMLGERVTVIRLLALALSVGFVLMVKFSGLLAIPILVLALIARAMMGQSWKAGRYAANTFSSRLAVSAGVLVFISIFVWGFTWACYDFRFLPARDSSDHFDFNADLRYFSNHQAFARSDDPVHVTSEDLENFWRHWQPPTSVRLILFADAHRLLPEAYLAGLLRIEAVSQARVTFLCGETSVTGWWYYFPLVMLFKTPAATLIGLIAAMTVTIRKLTRKSIASFWPVIAWGLTPGFYFLVAITSNVNVGVRHILPVYPFLFILLGVAAAAAWKSAKRAARWIITFLTIALAAESAFAFPNFIPFFNVFAGGSRGGLRLLGESNIDWGQDLPALAAWQRAHPDRPIYLLYWGSADPRYYGLHYVNLPESIAPEDQANPGPGKPVYVFSAVVLDDPFVRNAAKGLFDSVARGEPLAVLNGSIYIYDSP
jgi:hypothetical protein